ncbi:SDR family oxidoreductase [Microbacterium sp. LWH7-1.2]|uniref:SDR family NAD(P)-dependent oxidoreductase n=1 Tax=Microbacterium sp. LWH7-1.2 TaxID=3135257 RepID=UPI0031398CBE
MTLLEGKSVIVTGAGRGLGRAYAFAAGAAGASIVVNDIDSVSADRTVADLSAAGFPAVAAPGATDETRVGVRLVDTALGEFGRLDGVVANAGVMRAASIWEETTANLEWHFRVNVVGVANVVVPAAKAMRDSGGGSVVLVTSGARTGLPGIGAYGASKGAVATLAWTWATELADAGIRVNAISPVANTDMFALAVNQLAPPPDPEQIAPVVTYLLSDRSRRITGQIVRFTGTVAGLYPSPVPLSAEASADGWTAEEIADAIEGPLAHGIADVSSGADLLRVPLEPTR